MTDPLAYILACLRRAADNAYPWSLTPTEAAALVAEVERLRGEADRERGVVVTYLTWRAEMSHYTDAVKEFVNAADEVANGVHHTIDYDEVLP